MKPNLKLTNFSVTRVQTKAATLRSFQVSNLMPSCCTCLHGDHVR